MSKPTAQDIVQQVEKHRSQIRAVFGTGAGKEILDTWQKSVAEGKLFYDDERTTSYAIGQRDFILEIIHIVRGDI